jgi:hypothetical protein
VPPHRCARSRETSVLGRLTLRSSVRTREALHPGPTSSWGCELVLSPTVQSLAPLRVPWPRVQCETLTVRTGDLPLTVSPELSLGPSTSCVTAAPAPAVALLGFFAVWDGSTAPSHSDRSQKNKQLRIPSIPQQHARAQHRTRVQRARCHCTVRRVAACWFAARADQRET